MPIDNVDEVGRRESVSKPQPKLAEYRAKRDFGATPEPSGAAAHHSGQRRFVVQHHRARRKHYDFRLEVDGVLASWAMPKGPSLDPSVRSLAVHVEDHPIEYEEFEGAIPGGQYGAGDVIVWDRGTYEPAKGDDPARAIRDGELHFDIEGDKLHGRFVLVRTRPDGRGQEQWLMLHKRDDHARAGWNPDDYPRSVKSGRTNDEVAANPEAMWNSSLPPEEAETPVAPADGAGKSPKGRKATGTRTARSGGKARATKPSASTKARAAKAAGTRASASKAPAGDTFPAPTEEELAALDSLENEGSWEFQGRSLKLTNLNKVLFPARAGGRQATKRDLVRYYAEISPFMLPYLVERPVNLHRFPNGVNGGSFWHKQLPSYAPEWITRWHNDQARPGESDSYAVVDSGPTLAWMANYGAVELHPWTSCIPDVDEPTWALIDIDPGDRTTFDEVRLLANTYRSGLEYLGVVALPKLTGRRGIHIWVPISPGYTFDDTRDWVERLSRAVGNATPDLVSWTWEKRRRGGLARLDFTQNAKNKTLAAPYSVRAGAGAPVSVPISWEELEDPSLRSDTWTIRDVLARLHDTGDPFRRLLGVRQPLPEL